MTKKRRNQYSWKFRDNESEEFYEWFDNQDNIANSLRSILHHVIGLYGNGDILDPSVQRQLYKNTFIIESLKNQNHPTDLELFNSVPKLQVAENKDNTIVPEEHTEVEKENSSYSTNSKSVKMNENHVEKKDLYSKVNPDLI